VLAFLKEEKNASRYCGWAFFDFFVWFFFSRRKQINSASTDMPKSFLSPPYLGYGCSRISFRSKHKTFHYSKLMNVDLNYESS